MKDTEIAMNDKIEELRVQLQKTEKERDELKEQLKSVQLTLSASQVDIVSEIDSLKQQNKELSIQLRSSQLALLVAKDKLAKTVASNPPSTPITDRDRESLCSSPTGSIIHALPTSELASSAKFNQLEAELFEIRSNIVRHHNELIKIVANFHVEIKLPALVPLPEPASHGPSAFTTPVKSGSASSMMHSAIPIDLSNGKVSDLQHSLTGNKARLAAMLEMGEKLKRPSSKASVLDSFEPLSRRSSFSSKMGDLNNSSFSIAHDDARANQFLSHVQELAQIVNSDCAVLERLKHVAEVVNNDIATKDASLKLSQTKIAELESALIVAKSSVDDSKQSDAIARLQDEKSKLQKQVEELSKLSEEHKVEISSLNSSISQANSHIASKTHELSAIYSHVREIESHVHTSHVEFHSVYKTTSVVTSTSTTISSSTHDEVVANNNKRMTLLSSTLSGMKQQLEHQNSDLTAHKATIVRLEEELLAARGSVQQLTDDCASKYVELEGVRNELITALEDLNAANASHAEVLKEFALLEESSQQQDKLHQESVDALKKQFESDKAALEKKAEQLQKITQKLLEEKKSWRADESKQELATVSEEVNSLNAELLALREEHHQEVHKLQHELSSSKLSSESLVAQLAAMENKLSSQFKEHHKEVLELKKQLAEQLVVQETRDAEAHGRLASQISEHSVAIAELEKSLSDTKELLAAAKLSAEESQKRFTTTKEALKKSDKKISDQANAIAESKKEIALLTTQNQSLENKVANMQMSTSQMEAPNDVLKGKCDELAAMSNELKAGNDTICALKLQVISLEDKISASEQNLMNGSEITTSLQEQLRDQTNKVSDLQNSLNETKKNSEDSNKQLKQRDKKISEQQNSIISLKNELAAIKNQNESLQKSLADLQKQEVIPASVLSEVAELNKYVEKLLQQTKQLEDDKLASELKFSEQLSSLNQEQQKVEAIVDESHFSVDVVNVRDETSLEMNCAPVDHDSSDMQKSEQIEFPVTDLGFLSWDSSEVIVKVAEESAPLPKVKPDKVKRVRNSSKKTKKDVSDAAIDSVQPLLHTQVLTVPEMSFNDWPTPLESKEVKTQTKHLEYILEIDTPTSHIIPMVDPSSIVKEKKAPKNAFRQAKTQKQLKAEAAASKSSAVNL